MVDAAAQRLALCCVAGSGRRRPDEEGPCRSGAPAQGPDGHMAPRRSGASAQVPLLSPPTPLPCPDAGNVSTSALLDGQRRGALVFSTSTRSSTCAVPDLI